MIKAYRMLKDDVFICPDNTKLLIIWAYGELTAKGKFTVVVLSHLSPFDEGPPVTTVILLCFYLFCFPFRPSQASPSALW